MFRISYNRAVLRIRIDTVTPLRIGAGDIGLDPTGADLTCVRTHHGVHGPTVYIPGSSLKGVIRAAAEASIRGQSFGHARGACDDPLDNRQSCGARYQRDTETPTHVIHAAHCLTCRLFGSQAIKGRASLRDLFPWSDHAAPGSQYAPDGTNLTRANRLELRHGVAIDRLLGSVKPGGLFEQELVPAGVSFFGDIALENYQVWQLGLLATAFEQLDTGLAQLGSSKSRGLGVVKLTVERILHEQAGRGARPCGVGELAAPDQRKAYGLVAEAELPASDGVRHGLAMRFEVEESSSAWLAAGVAALGALS